MHRRDHLTGVFGQLGDFLRQFPDHTRSNLPGMIQLNTSFYDPFGNLIEQEQVHNPWFTPEYLERALLGIARMLGEKVLHHWLGKYQIALPGPEAERTVGLVMAGNIPLVGFHDMLCVLVSGHRILAKASSKDDRIIKMVAQIISAIDPDLGDRIKWTNDRLSGIDAVIATGSHNSARYFEYYFREIPHIIRKNRNGVAVLTGSETDEELEKLGEDIFTYFGLGCRNVTKLFVPEIYDMTVLMGVLDRFRNLAQHNKYANNVDYYRSIYLMNRQDFLDNGVIILKEDSAIASPVGVVFYERYSEIGSVQRLLKEHQEEIQCTVSLHPGIPDSIPPGSTQDPMPWEYADGVDTLRFLTELH